MKHLLRTTEAQLVVFVCLIILFSWPSLSSIEMSLPMQMLYFFGNWFLLVILFYLSIPRRHNKDEDD